MSNRPLPFETALALLCASSPNTTPPARDASPAPATTSPVMRIACRELRGGGALPASGAGSTVPGR